MTFPAIRAVSAATTLAPVAATAKSAGSRNDLVSARAAGAESDMEARGLRNVDGFDAGNGKGTIWWNGRTGPCLQMITADGRADSIADIQTHDACR